VTGKLPVIVTASSAADIRAAIRFGQQQHLKIILAGARDAWQAIPEIKAALAEAYGLAPEDALKSITLAPAQILGLDSELGSLAVGKRANLILASGDPIDPRSQIKSVYIDGQLMPPSKHQRLYQQWMARPDGGH